MVLEEIWSPGIGKGDILPGDSIGDNSEVSRTALALDQISRHGGGTVNRFHPGKQLVVKPGIDHLFGKALILPHGADKILTLDMAGPHNGNIHLPGNPDGIGGDEKGELDMDNIHPFIGPPENALIALGKFEIHTLQGFPDARQIEALHIENISRENSSE